jgi:hypothetical protein
LLKARIKADQRKFRILEKLFAPSEELSTAKSLIPDELKQFNKDPKEIAYDISRKATKRPLIKLSSIRRVESKSQDFESEDSFDVSVSQLEKALTINFFDHEFIDLDLECLSPKRNNQDSNKLIPPIDYAVRSKDNKRFSEGFSQSVDQFAGRQGKQFKYNI